MTRHMHSRYRSTPARVAVVVLLGIAAAAVTSTSTAPPATADDGIGITITVPTASPTPVSTSPASPTSGSSGGGGSKSPATTKPVGSVAPVKTASVTPEAGVVDLGGKLFIGGLSSRYTWSSNPLAGDVDVSFTVRNVSKETFSSSVHFWVDGPFANRLDVATRVLVSDLKPDESRVVEATLSGIGQWAFVQTHATFTPPDTVEGAKLAPVTRSQFLVVPPLYALGAALLVFAAASVPRFLRSRGLGVAALAGAPA
jgi:hypothetical protein